MLLLTITGSPWRFLTQLVGWGAEPYPDPVTTDSSSDRYAARGYKGNETTTMRELGRWTQGTTYGI